MKATYIYTYIYIYTYTYIHIPLQGKRGELFPGLDFHKGLICIGFPRMLMDT